MDRQADYSTAVTEIVRRLKAAVEEAVDREPPAAGFIPIFRANARIDTQDITEFEQVGLLRDASEAARVARRGTTPWYPDSGCSFAIAAIHDGMAVECFVPTGNEPGQGQKSMRIRIVRLKSHNPGALTLIQDANGRTLAEIIPSAGDAVVKTGGSFVESEEMSLGTLLDRAGSAAQACGGTG